LSESSSPGITQEAVLVERACRLRTNRCEIAGPAPGVDRARHRVVEPDAVIRHTEDIEAVLPVEVDELRERQAGRRSRWCARAARRGGAGSCTRSVVQQDRTGGSIRLRSRVEAVTASNDPRPGARGRCRTVAGATLTSGTCPAGCAWPSAGPPSDQLAGNRVVRLRVEAGTSPRRGSPLRRSRPTTPRPG
jgi:hypothetical protein